jgi:hypothetical protein
MPNQVDAALQAMSIDNNLDQVAILHFANRPSRQGFRSDVADTRSRRDTGEASVGEYRNLR